MKAKIITTTLSTAVLTMVLPILTECAQTGKPHTNHEQRGRGMVVDSRLAKAVTQKKG